MSTRTIGFGKMSRHKLLQDQLGLALIIFMLIFANVFACNGVEKSDQTQKPTIRTSKTNVQKQTSFEKKSQSLGIVIGTPADEVLKIRGKALTVEVMGKDDNGIIVEWEYRDGIYVMRRSEINGVTCYRVSDMKL